MGSSLSLTSSKESKLANGDGEANSSPRLPEDKEVERSDVHTEGQNFDDQPDINSINEPQITKLMHALQRIAKLQREATKARIASREIHREALLKRKNVWVSDANFMKEVQYLVAKGKLAGFEELLRLANACQKARDGLGPIEQNDIEVEQRWEGQIWKLRHAEQHLYSEFKDEFETAENYSTASPSVASSPYRSSSDIQSQASNEDVPYSPPLKSNEKGGYFELSSSFGLIPSGFDKPTEHTDHTPHDQVLLGMEARRIEKIDVEESMGGWGSGFNDIEAALSRSSPPVSFGPRVPLQDQVHFRGLHSFPRLLTDFSSIKERINRWLEDSTLSSHVEGMSVFNVLQHELEAKNISVPSNWAQLVIAYWELEVENVPSFSQALAAGKQRQQQAENEAETTALEFEEHYEPGQEHSYLAAAHEPGDDMASILSLEQRESQNTMISSMSSGQTLASPYALSLPSCPRSQQNCDKKHNDRRKDHKPP
jgi:hypothetical protein